MAIGTNPKPVNAITIAVAAPDKIPDSRDAQREKMMRHVRVQLSDRVSRLPLTLSPKRAVTNTGYCYKYVRVVHDGAAFRLRLQYV